MAITLLLQNFSFHFLEFYSYDIRMRMSPNPPTSGEVATVVIDSQTIATYEGLPDALDHSAALKLMIAARPKAIIYLLNPQGLQGRPSDFELFSQVTQEHPYFFVGLDTVIVKGQESTLALSEPFTEVPTFAAPTTVDRANFAQDGVTRRMLTSYEGLYTLHPYLIQEFYGHTEADLRGLFDFLGANQLMIRYRRAGSYPQIKFEDLSNPSARQTLSNKIVIVGLDTSAQPEDYVRTPFDRDSIEAMTKLELHANMFDTLIRNDAYIQVPQLLNLIVTFITALLAIYIVLMVRPMRGILLIIGIISGFSVLSYLLFAFFGVWVEMARSLVAIFVCYYFFIPYRLVMENRRSWEYQQRNKLLTQVEELKTNFMSMMSHDLKTPLARIQGMVELILRREQAGDPCLDSDQTKALQQISQSASELTDFVSSVLSLSRIETSQSLDLHLQSKDINHLLEEVIEKTKFAAREKNIEIRCELEPLFSVQMDVDLMRQVFTNLVENAIKYSPKDSSILITSEESQGRVIVQVADQGVGIPDSELSNIFMKFYRSRQAKTSTIKGSGLGLYLARYFVEMHHGQISAESDEGQGSTFTVELPISPASHQTT